MDEEKEDGQEQSRHTITQSRSCADNLWRIAEGQGTMERHEPTSSMPLSRLNNLMSVNRDTRACTQITLAHASTSGDITKTYQNANLAAIVGDNIP